MCLHDRVTDCSNALEKVLRKGGGRPGKGFDEDDAGVGLATTGIDTLDTDRHDVRSTNLQLRLAGASLL